MWILVANTDSVSIPIMNEDGQTMRSWEHYDDMRRFVMNDPFCKAHDVWAIETTMGLTDLF